MDTVSDVSNVLLNQYDTDTANAMDIMKNRGYITAGNSFYKFNPQNSKYEIKPNADVINEFEVVLNNTWVQLEPKTIESKLHKNLPSLSSTMINNFHEYNEQSKINIDSNLTDKITAIVNENEQKKSNRIRDSDFSIRNQIQILRNNDIFSDGVIGLYQYDSKTNDFVRIVNKNVSDIFKENLEPIGYHEELSASEIGNYWSYYVVQLTKIDSIIGSLKEKSKKERILKSCKKDYDIIFNLVKSYVGGI